MLQGVLFDFDGIIADTERLHWRAFQQVLPVELQFSWEAYGAEYIGYDDRGVFQQVYSLAETPLSSEQLKSLIQAKACWFEEQVLGGQVPLFPGVVQLIEEAGALGAVGIVSGALRSDIVPILKQHGLRHHFAFLVTAEDVQESKPHPASYQLGVQKLQALNGGAEQFPTSSILAIEDTPAGLQSAQSAGIKTLGIGHTYPLEELKADVVAAGYDGLTLDHVSQKIYEQI